MTLALFLRLQRGLTQSDVAEQADTYRHVVAGVEKNRINPSSEERAALSRVLGCDPSQLQEHVSAAPLGDGAEFRAAQAEAD